MIDTDDIDQAKLERLLNGSSIQRRSSTEQATHHIGYTRVISTYTRTTWIYFLDEEITRYTVKALKLQESVPSVPALALATAKRFSLRDSRCLELYQFEQICVRGCWCLCSGLRAIEEFACSKCDLRVLIWLPA